MDARSGGRTSRNASHCNADLLECQRGVRPVTVAGRRRRGHGRVRDPEESMRVVVRGMGVAALLASAGCSGKDGSSDSATSLGGDDDDDNTPVALCSVPTFEIDGMTCDQLGSAWDQVILAAKPCEVDADCNIVHPDCTN